MRGKWVVAALVVFALVSCTKKEAPAPVSKASLVDRDVCYGCFWQSQTPGLKKKVATMYSQYACPDDLCKGEVAYVLANVTGNPTLLEEAERSYQAALEKSTEPRQKLLLSMMLGMSGGLTGADESTYLTEASRVAHETGREALSKALVAIRDGKIEPLFEGVEIRRNLAVPPDAKYFTLGESRIVVPKGMRVGVQAERTYRDWLSYKMKFDFRDESTGIENVLNYHEGARLRDLMKLQTIKPVPLTATLLAEKDGKWYAPDDEGIFRFRVLDDKVWYPTTKRHGSVAMMTDTHGISAIVDQAIAEKTDLVLACADFSAKTDAAYYLATKNINVYFPCDREVANLVGYDAPGVLIGSGPVHKIGDEVVIGGQPVKFMIGETIVVTDVTGGDSIARYYDAPAKFFRALARTVPINLVVVPISGTRQTSKAVAQAMASGASAIGVRVRYEEDYQSVKEWLAKSPANRAVLFHSAPYEPGYRLFAEFPQQVTFGDPRPRFSAM